MDGVNIIIDTDPGIDDALAIILALNSPELNVIGLTSTYGNMDVETTTRNILRILGLMDRLDIKVYKGAYRPIIVEPGYMEDLHGSDGLGDVNIPYPDRGVDGPAVEFLVNMAREYRGDLTIICLGPLTNIALSILLDREFIDNVSRIISMGGAFNLTEYGRGSMNPLAEFNIYSDPHAASIVYSSGARLYAVGLDVTMDPGAMIDSNELELISGLGRIGKIFYDMARRIVDSRGSIALHDPIPVSYLIDGSILEFREYNVVIETAGLESMGATIIDFRDLPDDLKPGSIVNVAYRIDTKRYKSLLYERVFKAKP